MYSSVALRQGDICLVYFLNRALEKVVRDSEIETKGTVCNKFTQILGYADDKSYSREVHICIEGYNEEPYKSSGGNGTYDQHAEDKMYEVTKRPENTKMLKIKD
jgi:hypothetical protein